MGFGEMRFLRACGGKDAEKKTPAREFGGYSRLLDKPTTMEAASAIGFALCSAALERGKDAVGIALWYGIGVSLAAAEKFAELTGMKKGF